MITRPITSPITRPITRGITEPGRGGDLTFDQWVSLLTDQYSLRVAHDFSSIGGKFVDTARTDPITTLGTGIGGFTNVVSGQPHAAQATPSKRPIWGRFPAGGTRNLLLNTIFAGAVSGTPGTAPTNWPVLGNNFGTITTAGEDLRVVTVAERRIFGQNATVAANTTYVFSAICDVEISAGFWNLFLIFNAPSGSIITYLVDGVIFANPNFGPSPGNNRLLEIRLEVAATAGTVSLRFGSGLQGPITADVTFRQLQFEIGSTRSNYQRATISADVTESGVRDVFGIRADGIDDCLQIAGLDLSNTDKVTFICGLRPLSNAAQGIFAEHTATSASTNGSFAMCVPGNPTSNRIDWISRGTAAASVVSTSASHAANNTMILIGQGDIGGDVSRLQVNLAEIGVTVTDQGTGNYANSTLNIFQRNNASLPFNGWALGHLYLCGAYVPPNVLNQVVRPMSKKMGLTL